VPSVARGSLLLLSARVVGNAGFFVAVVLLARGLGPTGRGTIAFLIVTALVSGNVVGFGMGESTTVFAAQRPALRAVLLSNLLLVTVAAALLGTAAICGLLLVLSDARPAGIGRTELSVLVLGIPATALAAAGQAFLLGCSRFGQQAVITAVVPWVYALALVTVWIGPGLSVVNAGLIWGATMMVSAIGLLLASARGVGLGRPSQPLIRESVTFGLRAWVGTLAGLMNARVDQVLMGFLATEAALGIYSIAVNGSEVLLYLPHAAAAALLPAVSRSAPELRGEQTLRVFRQLLVITTACLAIALVLGPPLFPIVFGEAFQDSVSAFFWLLPGVVGYATIIVFSNALVATSRPGLSSVTFLVALVVGIALDFALIPRFGADGAAAAATIAYLCGGATALVAFRARIEFAWTALVPDRRDVQAIIIRVQSALGMRVRRPPAA
jgi:O-antigen/teichoic acid export membrane protein